MGAAIAPSKAWNPTEPPVSAIPRLFVGHQMPVTAVGEHGRTGPARNVPPGLFDADYVPLWMAAVCAGHLAGGLLRSAPK